MEENYILTAPGPQELNSCFDIILQEKAFQKEQGFTQWTEDYPSSATLNKPIFKKGCPVKQKWEIFIHFMRICPA